ncbi:MAG: hypothetical protein QW590_03595 [Candidatus Bilamarchaeaceae archaeon]
MTALFNCFRKKRKGNDPKGDDPKPEKETFKELTTRNNSAIFAAAALKDHYLIFSRYRGKENDEEVGWIARALKEDKDKKIANFEKEKEKINAAKIPEDKKNLLLELYSSADKEDAWDFEYTRVIAMSYVEGHFGEDWLNYSISALKAWREKKIKEFAKQAREDLKTNTELSEEEKKILTEMVDIALEKNEDLSIAIIMRRFISDLFDKTTPVEEKVQKAKESMETFRYL